MRTFDFVVVGAGSAGSVLAERLSAGGRHSVAVVEAGGSDRRFYVQMPLGYGKTFYDPAINWGYRAEPDPGLAGNADYWPRGRILGGSGSLNAMVWMRGDRRDFDDWAAEGNPGWGFDDVLPIFKALEDNEAGADAHRGTGGPVRIADVSKRMHPVSQRFVAACRELGFPANPDFNGAEQEGVGCYQLNIRDGWRCSAAKAFLRPARGRANLAILTEAFVTRLLVEGRRVTGVEIRRGGTVERLLARREVVLAAGAVGSPILMQRSGLGPAAHLAAIGVPVAMDLPAVGRHLQDHLGINYVFRSRVPTLNQVLRPWWGKAKAGVEFLLFGRGPLSMSLNQGGGFVRARPEDTRPTIQLYLQAISTSIPKQGERPLLTPDPFPGFALGLSNCKPEARGEILARAADPDAAPIIRPNAFGAARDLDEMLAGVKLLRRIAAAPALAEIVEAEIQPGPSIVSDADLIDDFRRRSGTVYHPCGTVRMGRDASVAGVDARLRVHGVEGLRVADASVFPSIPSGNINAPTMMVAAKAAGMILEDAAGR